MTIEKVRLGDFLRKLALGDDLRLRGVILFIHPKTEVLLEGVQVAPREVLITYRHRVDGSKDWGPYPSKWGVNSEYTVYGISLGRMERVSWTPGSRSYIRIECMPG